MSVDPFSPPQTHATFAVATQPELRARARPLVPHGAGERLAHEAEAYLAAVEVFRDEGFEPKWRSNDARDLIAFFESRQDPKKGENG